METTFVSSEVLGSGSRKLVLDQAAKLFRARGYAAVSMRDIAATSGMRAASLYHHFSSKEDIVTEVLNLGVLIVFREVRRSVGALPEEASFERRLHAAVEAHLMSLLEGVDYTGANIRIFAHIPENVRRSTIGPRREYEQWWMGLLQKGIDAGDLARDADATLLTLLLLGAMNSSLEWFRPRLHDVRDIARRLTVMTLFGHAAGQPHRLSPIKGAR